MSKPLQVQIPVGEGLAMKADLRIPWNEMRTLRRLHNISSASLVYVPDLSGKILQLLEPNDRYLCFHLCITCRITQNTFLKVTREGRLISHKGVIPPGQIWMKLGGDKGGSSMKM